MSKVTIAAATMTASDLPTIERARATFRVCIHVDETNALRIEQARLALGILSRTFTNVRIAGVVTPANKARVASLAGPTQWDHGASDAHISFGSLEAETPVIFADFAAWAARLSTMKPPGVVGANALAALYSAALACQHVFNAAFKDIIPGIDLLEGDAGWDLATGVEGATPSTAPVLEEHTPTVDFTLVGVGAVGQAICHSLSVVPRLLGSIVLIDHEFIDDGNAERYLLGRQYVGQYKPHVGRAVLAQSHPLLRVRYPAPEGEYPPVGVVTLQYESRHALPTSAGSPGWAIHPRVFLEFLTPPLHYLGWRDMDGGSPRRLVVAAVDSIVTRRDIQFGLHREALNVWTDSGEALNSWGFTFHRIGTEACMACTYHEAVSDPGSAIDFKARQVGWPVERVRRYLEDPNLVLQATDLEDLQRRKGFTAEYLAQFHGKPLRRLIEGLCGQGAAVGNDRISAPPVPHVPAIVGIHAAAAIVLRALGFAAPARIQGDSLRWRGTSFALPIGEPRAGCLCRDARVQKWYQQYWQLPG